MWMTVFLVLLPTALLLLCSLDPAAFGRKTPVPSASMPTFDPQAACVAVILIHGTFARNARWTRPHSPLRDELQRQAPGKVAFYPLEWSGRNSFSARAAAADKLRALVDSLFEADSTQHICIVAHSHGGNVALQALSIADTGNKVARVVCISTPFLVLNEVFTSLIHIDNMQLMMGSVSLAVFIIPVAQLAFWIHPDDLLPLFEWVVAVCWAVGAIFMCRGLILKRIRPKLVVQASSPEPRHSEKVLILRSSGDEASAVMAVSHLLTYLLTRLFAIAHSAHGGFVAAAWKVVLSPRRRVALLMSVGVLALVIVCNKELPRYWNICAFFAVHLVLLLFTFSLIWTAFASIAVVSYFALSVASAISMGWELLFAGPSMRFTAESTPTGRWRTLTIQPTPGRLHEGFVAQCAMNPRSFSR